MNSRTKIEQAESHLNNLRHAIEEIGDPYAAGSAEITPEDKLFLNKIKESLEIKATQLRKRHETASEAHYRAEESLEELESFVDELDNAVSTVEDVLKY